MNYVVTTCCKNKNLTKKLIPAIDRYLDTRLRMVYEFSLKRKLPMLIFSGKFGMLKPKDKIPYYDLRLEPNMVNKITKKIIKQFKSYDVDKIELYGLDEIENPDWKPYYDALEGACLKLNIKLNKIYLDNTKCVE